LRGLRRTVVFGSPRGALQLLGLFGTILDRPLLFVVRRAEHDRLHREFDAISITWSRAAAAAMHQNTPQLAQLIDDS